MNALYAGPITMRPAAGQNSYRRYGVHKRCQPGSTCDDTVPTNIKYKYVNATTDTATQYILLSIDQRHQLIYHSK